MNDTAAKYEVLDVWPPDVTFHGPDSIEKRVSDAGLDDGRCSRCGQRITWRVIVESPEGELSIVGRQCAESIVDYQEFKLKQREAEEKLAAMKRHAEGVTFFAQHPGLEEAFKVDHAITRDILERFRRYGQISEKQIALVFKIAEDDKAKEARAAERAKRLEGVKLEEGRRVVEGVVISWRFQESDFGTVRKMLVEEDSGARIWGTVAAALDEFETELRGRRVRFTGKVTRSRDDKAFGFFSRPSKTSFVS